MTRHNGGARRRCLLATAALWVPVGATVIGSAAPGRSLIAAAARRGVATASSWKIEATPTVVGALYGTACPSATVCVAVGTSRRAGASVPLAEHWNGSSWAVQSAPEPAHAHGGILAAVACASATACTAVGNFTLPAAGEFPLIERWNGVTWLTELPPLPTGGRGGWLEDVACPSTTLCIAVGGYSNSVGQELPFAEMWSGSGWSAQSTPVAPGATVNLLESIGCASDRVCIAVGNYTGTAGVVVTLVERWNGRSWELQSVPTPSGAEDARLFDVSCPSTILCLGTGYYNNGSRAQVTLAEQWDGTSWAVRSTPNPAGAEPVLYALACSSTTTCAAVGNYYVGSGGDVTLALSWNRPTWSVHATPNPAGSAVSYLIDVACPSTTVCVAVGASSGHALIEGRS